MKVQTPVINKSTTQKSIPTAEFISIIAMLMALVGFSINMILPAFKDITEELALSNENRVQLMVSLLYLGLALGQIIYGPASDSMGRKSSLYLGLIVFIAGCMISFFAPTLSVLITGQIIQGIGLGAPRIVTLAIVRDNFEGDHMGKVMSFVMLVFIVVPTISPALGQGVLFVAGWRFIFIVFIILTSVMLLWVYLRLPETLEKNKRKPISFIQLKNRFLEVIKNKYALGYTIVLGLSSTAFISYLNLSQQIFQLQYGLGPLYPMYFAILSLSLGCALLVNSQLVMRFGMNYLSKSALWATSISASVFAIVTIVTNGSPPFWALMVFMMLVLFCFGILVGNLNAMALKPLGHIAGIGAAIIGSISTMISVPFSIVVGNSYSGSVLPLVLGFALFGSLALGVYYWVTKDKQTV
ncbi:multidrug effflux MFS transporter [Fulvivirga sp. M361]|uniref:multidrug effflux MFS transporter n=1 Tax=Fulvivirga sp. M361 TaxID=2594266 RepID=UPI00117B7687|nr:multidrug effflux MFS transporter [Fulvivirga sp. M361]TRX57683.1 multidrug effflux MFS transporter [Fulvivirga sp. M361]